MLTLCLYVSIIVDSVLANPLLLILVQDVECTFGILKGRFRILKTGIPLHGITVCDRVWLTCCALHNFLLEEDGLDGQWGASSYLSEANSQHDYEDIEFFFQQGNSNRIREGQNAFDASGLGAGTDKEKDEDIDTNRDMDLDEEDDTRHGLDGDGAVLVPKLKLEYFRGKLVEHFDILWKKNRIVWPTRTGDKTPEVVMERYM